MTAHHAGPHWGDAVDLLLAAAVFVLAAAYLLLVAARRREPRGWSHWRTVSFLTGCALLLAAVIPALSPFPEGDLRGHMHQHLLLGMYAPLGLVLGAPITLLLRTLRAPHGRRLTRALRSPPLQFVTHPITAVILNLGGLAALYITPLYVAAADNPALHHLVHVHFLAAGCLFAWVIAGPDPAPHRPSVPTRLVVLGVAILGHAILAQLMYAGVLVSIPASAQEFRGAGDLMYYGGDIAELLLAMALLATWRPRSRQRSGRIAGARPITVREASRFTTTARP
jgi:putative membrane protein